MKVAVSPSGQARQSTETNQARRSGVRAEFVMHALHRRAKVAAGPGPARRVHARRAAERGDAEAEIVGQRRQPAARAAASALIRALPAKVRRVLVRLGQAEFARGHDLDRRAGAAAPASRAACPGCGVARTSRLPRSSRRAISPQRLALQRRTAASVPRARERHQRQELRLGERVALGRALDLDDAAALGQHEVGVRLRAAVLGVVEVEHGLAADQSRSVTAATWPVRGDRVSTLLACIVPERQAAAPPRRR